MAAGERCDNCKFGLARHNEQGQVMVFLCRRKPPVVSAQFVPVPVPDEPGTVRMQGVSDTYWPAVRPDDWCGEHAPGIQVVPGSRLKS
jgi:hypothetical protein